MFEKVMHTVLFIVSIILITVGIVYHGFTTTWLIYLFLSIYTMMVIMSIVIYQSTRLADVKISWIMAIFLFPLIGAVMYFILGRPYKHSKARTNAMSQNNDLVDKETWSESEDFFIRNNHSGFRLASNISKRPVYTNSTVEYMKDGVDKFRELCVDLKKATKYIHIQYFIIKDSEIWNRIEEIIIAKANEGVEVKVLVDGVGTIKFPKKKIKKLISNGIDFQWYKKFSFSAADNYRNHRKLVIIDGEVGYTGGINVGDEYMHKSKKFGYWRDSAVRLQGSCLISLQLIFLMDWKTATKKSLNADNYLKYIKPVQASSRTSVLIADDGPGIGTTVFLDLIQKLIISSKERIWITTPYLIITDSLITALKTAVNSGVDVRIIIPGKPDKKLVYASSKNFGRILTRIGVKVYKYSHNFIHAKQYLIDDELIIGTANFDNRSFTQNYELFVYMNNKAMVDKLESEFENDFQKSKILTDHISDDMGLLDGFKSLILKIISPLF